MFEMDGGGIEEIHGHLGCSENRDAMIARHGCQVRVEGGATCHDNARDATVTHLTEAFHACRLRQFSQIRELGISQDLHAFFGKIGEKPGQGEAWPVHGRLADRAVEADFLTE